MLEEEGGSDGGEEEGEKGWMEEGRRVFGRFFCASESTAGVEMARKELVKEPEEGVGGRERKAGGVTRETVSSEAKGEVKRGQGGKTRGREGAAPWTEADRRGLERERDDWKEKAAVLQARVRALEDLWASQRLSTPPLSCPTCCESPDSRGKWGRTVDGKGGGEAGEGSASFPTSATSSLARHPKKMRSAPDFPGNEAVVGIAAPM